MEIILFGIVFLIVFAYLIIKATKYKEASREYDCILNIIASCRTEQQLNNTLRLIKNFYKKYPFQTEMGYFLTIYNCRCLIELKECR